MKTSLSAAAKAALSLIAISLATQSMSAAPKGNNNNNGQGQAKKEPLIPVGSLTAFPVVVQTGTHPTLNWDIQYPETATDIVIIEEDGTITPREDLCMKIKVLGASYQTGWTNQGKPVWGWVQSEVKVGGSSAWDMFFYNTQDNVQPTSTYYSATVLASRPIEFRARAYNGSYWLPSRSTEASSANVVPLVNGDQPPQTIAAFNQGDIESFLQPYLDASGYVTIGPKDVILLIELGQVDPTKSGFDLQDLVLLVSFDYCKNNNGHGNNIDGVDVSNPGNGQGGPNGQEDPSGDIDDEKK